MTSLAQRVFAEWWFKNCPHQDIIKQDPKKAYRRLARLAFEAGAANNPDYKLWLLVVHFMENLTILASEQHGEAVAELKELRTEFEEKVEKANRQLGEEEVAAGAEEPIHFLFPVSDDYEELYRELTNAVKDLLHVTRTKDGVSIDMMRPLSRLGRLVEGEAKESEEKP